MAVTQRASTARRPRRAVLTLLAVAAAALVWLLVALTGSANSGGTYAAWNSTLKLQSVSLKTGSASVGLSGFDALTHQFTAGSLSEEAAVTLSNTGSVPLSYFSAQTSTSTSAFASALKVSIWPRPAGTTACASAPGTASAGTWAALPNWLAGQQPIAPGASATYCVLTTIAAGDVTANAGASLSPSVTVTAATGANGTGWTAGPVSAAAFTFSTPAPAPFTSVTPSTIGITPVTNGNLNVTAQEQVSPGLVCVNISVTATDNGNSQDTWQFKINTATAPFSGAPLAKWNWTPQQPTGYATGTITSGPTNNVITVGGVGNTAIYGFNAQPTATSSTVNNTPINGSETAVVSICIPQSS